MTMIALMTMKKNEMVMTTIMTTIMTIIKMKRIKRASSPHNVDKDCKR